MLTSNKVVVHIKFDQGKRTEQNNWNIGTPPPTIWFQQCDQLGNKSSLQENQLLFSFRHKIIVIIKEYFEIKNTTTTN